MTDLSALTSTAGAHGCGRRESMPGFGQTAEPSMQAIVTS
jgi:hypothetical protein